MKVWASIDNSVLLEVLPNRTDSRKEAPFTNLCELLALPIHYFNADIIGPVEIGEVFSSLSPIKDQRDPPRLILMGSYLEEQITVCALHGLFLGYDVYLLRDLIQARDTSLVGTFDSRLGQAGVVHSTTRQMLVEWLANETLISRQEKIRAYLATKSSADVAPR